MDFKEVARYLVNNSDYSSIKLQSESILERKHADDFDEKMREYNYERADLLKDLKLIQNNPTDSTILENVYGKYKDIGNDSFDLSNGNLESLLNQKPNFLLDDMPNTTSKTQQEEFDFCNAQIKSFSDELMSIKREKIEPTEFCLDSIIQEFTSMVDLLHVESDKLHDNFKFVQNIELKHEEDVSNIGDSVISACESLKKIKQFCADKKAIMIVEENLKKSLSRAEESNNLQYKTKVLDLVHKILLQLEAVTFQYKV